MVNLLKCEQVWQEISNYLEGEMDAGLRASMDEHFRTCKSCTSVLEGTRNVIRLYGDERMIDVPAGYGRRLERRLAQNAREARRGWSTWSAWLVPVAAMALFAGGIHVANSVTVSEPLRSEHAQEPEGIPPDMTVVVTADARLFHAPDCGVIHNKATERTMTAKEAMREGYAPCLRCLRKYMQTTASNILDDPDDDGDVEAKASNGQGSH